VCGRGGGGTRAKRRARWVCCAVQLALSTGLLTCAGQPAQAESLLSKRQAPSARHDTSGPDESLTMTLVGSRADLVSPAKMSPRRRKNSRSFSCSGKGALAICCRRVRVGVFVWGKGGGGLLAG
jgi:hypothetical protein